MIQVKRWWVVVTLLCVPVLLTQVAPGRAQAQHTLEILEEVISISTDDTMLSVTVRNNGPMLKSLQFCLFLTEATGDCRMLILDPAVGIKAYAVAAFALKLPDEGLGEATDGFLVVSGPAGKGVTPGVVPFEVEGGPRGHLGSLPVSADTIVLGGFGIALLLFVFSVWWVVRKEEGSLKKKLWQQQVGPLEWDFTKNWASTFTAVGGILGVVVGASIFPEKTQLLERTVFQAVNVLFPILIIMAPFVVISLSHLHPEAVATKGDDRGKVKGTVLAFLLGSAIVVWAVVGELLALLLLLEELRLAATLTMMAARVFQVLLVVLLVLGLIYMVRRPIQFVLAKEEKEVWRNQGQVQARRPVYLP